MGLLSCSPLRLGFSGTGMKPAPILKSLQKTALLVKWPTRVGEQGWHPTPSRSTLSQATEGRRARCGILVSNCDALQLAELKIASVFVE